MKPTLIHDAKTGNYGDLEVLVPNFNMRSIPNP
jgi:hypothetical protein